MWWFLKKKRKQVEAVKVEPAVAEEPVAVEEPAVVEEPKKVVTFEECQARHRTKEELKKDARELIHRAREKIVYEPSDEPNNNWTKEEFVNWLLRGIPDRDAQCYYGDKWLKCLNTVEPFNAGELLDIAYEGC